MEKLEKKQNPVAELVAANDNQGFPRRTWSRAFPEDAVARIYRPSRSPMTSASGRTKGWRLRFERRSAPVIEPLMGYTSGDDTLTQVELGFPTLASAVRYVERQGLTYTVQGAGEHAPEVAPNAAASRSFSDATLERLGHRDLQETYGVALEGAANRNDPSGPGSWSSPMGVVADPTLSLDAKRSILMNWAWTEYQLDQATNEGMPESRSSRLDAVEQALLALERDVAGEQRPAMGKAA